MKKKVKLFTTIASLCLAVALMAFGVYAATTVNYGVKNYVTFEAVGYINAKIEYKHALTNCTVKGQTKILETDGDIAAVSTADYVKVWETTNTTDADPAGTINFGDVELALVSSEENMIYSYTIRFTNLVPSTSTATNSTLQVEMDKAPAKTFTLADNGYVVTSDDAETVKTAAKATAGSEGAGDTFNYVEFTVTIEVDPQTSIADVDLGSHFILTMIAG